MSITFGTRIPGLMVNGREVNAPVFNEHAVRAAAGLTMVIGAVAFSYAYFKHDYVPLQATTVVFFVEFLTRVIAGIRYSPLGCAASWMTRYREPDWVSAKPKRFAWSLALGLSSSMVIITNSGIRGWLPRSLCLVCLTLMWLESVLGLCLGCQLYALLVRRGWKEADSEYEVCADGVCQLPAARGL
jgi:hypothetical protein